MSEFLVIGRELISTCWEAIQNLLPILAFFVVFQALYLKLPWERVAKVGQGLLLCLVGLTLFLFGVEYGFLPAGEKMGMVLGNQPLRWILIPLGFILGFIVTTVEPAVRVLSEEVDKVSSGYISAKLVMYAMALGVAGAVALGMVRVIYGLPIHYLIIPGYLLVIVILKFSSSTFTSIAFDAGGVATGPMITTFVVAITLGTADILEGRDPVIDGFGLIALVALFPIITALLLGLLFHQKEEEAEIKDKGGENQGEKEK